MKKTSIVILLILSVATNLFSQDFKQIADGIEYAEMMRGTEKEPIRLNLLRLDLTKVRLDVVHALDAAIGLEKTSSIATRHGAIAAINAGFFLMQGVYQGDAVGALKIDGKVLSENYANRIALGIFNDKEKTEINFAHLNSENFFFRGNQNAISITGINRLRQETNTILYTPEFHRTTLTTPEGTEYVIRKGKVVEVNFKRGSSIIPSDGFVISSTVSGNESFLQLKDTVKVVTKFNPIQKEQTDFFNKSEDIIAGVPQLIKNGKIAITWQEEKIGKDFVETKHPRTAVAKLKDGKFLMVTVDGRQPEHSIGINLYDLAALLLELGAMDAMNLDGGGSTTMFLNGEIKNKPSDKTGERSVSDAILVFPRKKK